MLTYLQRLIWANLGHCSYCIRKAFLFSALAWLSVGAAMALYGWPAAGWVALLAAMPLTLLWLAHLLVFAGKATSRATSAAQRTGMSRRDVMPFFARTFAGVATASVLSSMAFADAQPCPFGCPQGEQCCSRPSGSSGCCKNCYTNDCVVPERSASRRDLADNSNCYCGGANWPIGTTACMGGQKTRCVSNGWASLNVPCDGNENCG